MSEQQILTIVVPVDLRDDVVDTLIGCETISGFNMSTIAGYSREHSQYDLGEQVVGYRELFQFDVMHQNTYQDELLSRLRAGFASATVRYWITSVREQGHV